MADKHACPGRCGRSVGRSLLACRDCWARLPLILRTAVTEGYARIRRNRNDGTAHRAAVLEALAWYRDNTGRVIP